jgi:hypothetical protein
VTFAIARAVGLQLAARLPFGGVDVRVQGCELTSLNSRVFVVRAVPGGGGGCDFLLCNSKVIMSYQLQVISYQLIP